MPERGRLTPTRSRHEPESRPPASLIEYFAATGFFAVLLVLVATAVLPGAVVGLYLVVSVLAFATYAQDKAAAQSHKRRIPEATLHMLALLGGWPGALVAQAALRHKTRKQPFRTIFFVVVGLNCVLLFVLASTLNALPG
jgi:uncharacterized membrane protein YsdA (DUF1294 family)